MRYRQILKLIILFVLYFFITPISFAQVITSNKSVVLANINLSNITILSQDGQNFRIAVDIVNNADVTQSDIRYGVELVKKNEKGQTKVATFVSDEVLTVGAKQTLHKEFSYQAPATLNGDYDLWVMSKMTSGLLLGLGSAGNVSLSGISGYVEIFSESCFLKVEGDDKHYTITQGVDISKEEALSLHCAVKNHFTRDVAVIPSFETHERTAYGSLVDMVYPYASEIVLNPNETKELSFTITKPEKPQAYDITVTLVEKTKNVPVSSNVVAHYVLRGISATIQNASLDKSAYKEGELITTSFYWTPSADNFLGSRVGKGTDIASTTIRVNIVDENGVFCVEPTTKEVTSKEMKVVIGVKTLIDCVSPRVSILMTDGRGHVLDNKEFLSPKKEVDTPLSAYENAYPWFVRIIFVAVAIIIILIILRNKIFFKKNA